MEIVIKPTYSILVTGSVGFIGMHLCRSLLKDNYNVVGFDNINNYYDKNLKRARLKKLKKYNNFIFENIDISNYSSLYKGFQKYAPSKVVNLAAQAGVLYSLENPHAYIETNIQGFLNVLECSRIFNIKNLVYASSSSVYGENKSYPFSTKDEVKKPKSIYAVSKLSNELMARAYSSLYDINTTGLRYFTVYGPWGRPDMALFIFTKNILDNEPIDVFNHGEMYRDFTYIDDVIEGTRSAIDKNYKCEVFNIGNTKSEYLMDMIRVIEETLRKKAKINFIDIQPGEVKKTVADISYTQKRLFFKPKTEIFEGIPKFIRWYKKYYKVR